jgi:hypothetical protein
MDTSHTKTHIKTITFPLHLLNCFNFVNLINSSYELGSLQIYLRNIKHKEHAQTLTDATKYIGLEVNTEKTKYVLLSRHQNAGQNHDMKTSNRGFENVEQF